MLVKKLNRVLNSYLFALIFLSVAVISFVLLFYLMARDRQFDSQRIAHAGGAYMGLSVTNSLEALEYNYAKGYRYFEIDLSFTSDNYLVCIHGWKSKKSPTVWGGVPTQSEFLEYFASQPLTPCTLSSLMRWLERHSDATVITDVKQSELIALGDIAYQFPNLLNQIIPQIYLPSDFNTVRAMGYDRVIWTLYRFDGSNEDVVNQVREFSPPFALVFSISRLNDGLIRALRKQNLNIPIYVHTINDMGKMCLLKSGFQIYEVFTDVLDPSVQCDLSGAQ